MREKESYKQCTIGHTRQGTQKTQYDFWTVGILLFVTIALTCSVIPVLAQSGKLKVKTIPHQAYVFVDGKAIHEASKGSIPLSPGDHSVSIYNYGYKPASRNVSIQAGKSANLDVTLEAVPGGVTGPWGCITIEKANRDAILLNGKTPEYFVGHGDEFNNEWCMKQELVVPPGTHQLTVFSGDKEAWSGSVSVAANQRVVIDIPKGVRKTVPWPRGEQLKTLPRFKAGTASATVAVAKPTAQLSASKTQINVGEATQLKWTSTEAPSVEISGLGKVAGSGDQSVQPLHDTTYKLTASGPGGTATASSSVSVNTAIQATLDISPGEAKYRRVGNKVLEQSKANLKWSTSNASAVKIEGFGQVDAAGSRPIEVTPQKTSVGPVDETFTYTLNATNAAGTSETRTAKLHVTGSIEPEPEVKVVEVRVTLYSLYFPTDQPTRRKPEGGLLDSQKQSLMTLAADFKKYLEQKPDARLVLTGHTDRRGSTKYNQALSERRAERVKQFLIDNGIPAAKIETRGVGKGENLNRDQVKQQIEQQASLNEAERKKILRKMPTVVLAQNRRVDITLSTTGEQSLRQYPFDAADSSILLSRSYASGVERKAKAVKK
jgi:outer membrane protein OmpA-like peptidoglycan-associated protein